jgi:ribosomal protein S6
MKKTEEKIVGDTRIYEISSLFAPELDSEALSQAVNSLKEKITQLEGKVISEGEPVYIKLAYTVEKHINSKISRIDYAHFYWVKFEIEPSNISQIEKFIDAKFHDKCFRYLTTKTIRDNTVLTDMVSANQKDASDDKLIEEVLKTDGEVASVDTITDLGSAEKPLVSTEILGEVAEKV